MPTQYSGEPQLVLNSLPLPINILSTTNTSPIILTSAAPHNCDTADFVIISGAQDPAANGVWRVGTITNTTMVLTGTTGTMAGGAQGQLQNLGFGKGLSYPIPVDLTDDMTAASVGIPLEALGDRAAYLLYRLHMELGHTPLADLAPAGGTILGPNSTGVWVIDATAGGSITLQAPGTILPRNPVMRLVIGDTYDGNAVVVDGVTTTPLATFDGDGPGFIDVHWNVAGGEWVVTAWGGDVTLPGQSRLAAEVITIGVEPLGPEEYPAYFPLPDAKCPTFTGCMVGDIITVDVTVNLTAPNGTAGESYSIRVSAVDDVGGTDVVTALAPRKTYTLDGTADPIEDFLVLCLVHTVTVAGTTRVRLEGSADPAILGQFMTTVAGGSFIRAVRHPGSR